MTSERLFNSFIPPKKTKKNFIPRKQISGYAPGKAAREKRRKRPVHTQTSLNHVGDRPRIVACQLAILKVHVIR